MNEQQQPALDGTTRPGAMDLFARSRWFPGLDGWVRSLVMTLAFLIDTALHAGVATGVWFAASEHAVGPQPAIVCAVLAWAVVSFAHRTFFQRLTHTTIGKAVFGLRLHNPGDYPITLWQLIKFWCFAVFLCLANVADMFP
ncbi:RDD family protein [Nocardia sp. BMG111209]|uniref:RDD family protein n=1 Tax=Nocardia sp. BMG111209 TaxID=1160137 RepID=UPI000378D8CE|nr:RDD family protein [Nocardia sp. BMG111209]